MNAQAMMHASWEPALGVTLFSVNSQPVHPVLCASRVKAVFQPGCLKELSVMTEAPVRWEKRAMQTTYAKRNKAVSAPMETTAPTTPATQKPVNASTV
jgi:hypothetical protein